MQTYFVKGVFGPQFLPFAAVKTCDAQLVLRTEVIREEAQEGPLKTRHARLRPVIHPQKPWNATHTHTSLFLDASLNPHKHATANVYNMTYFWVFRKESIHRNDWWMNAECHFSALTYWWLAPEEVPRSFPQEQHRDPTLTLLSGHLKPGQGARRLRPWGSNPTTHDGLA